MPGCKLYSKASKKEPAYANFLFEVTSAEADARRQRYLKTRLQAGASAVCEDVRSVRFRFPTLDRRARTVHAAVRARSIECHFAGPPGVGKTHVVAALAETAIQSAQAAYFITAHDLITDLGRAYREGRLDRPLRIYLAPKVLIVDEMGLCAAGQTGRDYFLSTGQRPL